MDLRELRYLLELGKTKHMAHAADKLYITQPALYKALKRVETELDTTLFYRNKNELLPTDTGRIVLEKAESVFELISQMTDDVAATKNLKKGKVSLGFPSIIGTLFLSNLLIEFQQKYPDISLTTREGGGISLVDMVASGDLDMALVMRPIYSDILNEIPIIKDQVTASVNKSHPWANKGYVKIRDFENVPFITFDSTFNMNKQLMERFEQENVYPNISFSGAGCQFLFELATLSNGILILPRPIIEFYAKGSVVTLPFQPSFPWELTLIFPKNTFISTASKALISHIQDYFIKNF